MYRSKYATVVLAVLIAAIPMTGYAAETATPSPTTMATPAKQVLTQAQKVAIVAARSAFSVAQANAQNGFDRALADAKALRDQSILAAGKNKTALAAARKSYRDSYRTIMNAYKIDMKNAKNALRSALAAAYSMHATR